MIIQRHNPAYRPACFFIKYLTKDKNMLFNSLAFAIFLPIVFFLYWALPSKYRSFFLLIVSYYFYMSWNVKYVVLILFTTVLSYGCARLLEKYPAHKKLFLWLTVAACMSVLFFFKYYNFFDLTIVRILQKCAIPVQAHTLTLLLPVGISFYTFQTLSYVIDVYRGEVEAERNFFTYAAFISFFPQLVAGPIERTSNLLPQIKGEHTFHREDAVYGLKLMAWGFFKKLVIADNLAVYVDLVFDTPQDYPGFAMLLAAFFFTIQIYCDFSGYSDIAIGTAKLFDIRLMQNFNSPYFAASVKEFWSRWHISLSTWFRDYVYIPLGGNRVGKLRHCANLLVTFLVSGLWHGAAFTYIIWGGLHGMLQILENSIPLFRAHIRRVKEGTEKQGVLVISRLVTFFLVMLAWVFFRAGSVSQAVYILRDMWTGIGHPLSYLRTGFAGLGLTLRTALELALPLALLAVYDACSLHADPIRKTETWNPVLRWSFYYGFMLLVILLASFNAQEFVYFQF